jgi:hypothetical protein
LNNLIDYSHIKTPGLANEIIKTHRQAVIYRSEPRRQVSVKEIGLSPSPQKPIMKSIQTEAVRSKSKKEVVLTDVSTATENNTPMKIRPIVLSTI